MIINFYTKKYKVRITEFDYRALMSKRISWIDKNTSSPRDTSYCIKDSDGDCFALIHGNYRMIQIGK